MGAQGPQGEPDEEGGPEAPVDPSWRGGEVPDRPAGEDEEADLDELDLGDDEDEEDAPQARLVVYGDFDFAADDQVMNGANSLLLLNTFNWLVKRDELIDIEAREPKQTSLNMSRDQIANVYLWVLVLLPGLAVIAGVWVYRSRRR